MIEDLFKPAGLLRLDEGIVIAHGSATDEGDYLDDVVETVLVLQSVEQLLAVVLLVELDELESDVGIFEHRLDVV